MVLEQFVEQRNVLYASPVEECDQFNANDQIVQKGTTHFYPKFIVEKQSTNRIGILIFDPLLQFLSNNSCLTVLIELFIPQLWVISKKCLILVRTAFIKHLYKHCLFCYFVLPVVIENFMIYFKGIFRKGLLDAYYISLTHILS